MKNKKPPYKMPKNRFHPITPMIKICECGGKVRNHHFLCDNCYSRKARRLNNKRKRKLKLI